MDLHAKGIDEIMIANALATSMPVNVSEVISDPIIKEATDALKAGGAGADPKDVHSVVNADKELLSLHELSTHRLFQILIGAHRGRTYSL